MESFLATVTGIVRFAIVQTASGFFLGGGALAAVTLCRYWWGWHF